MAILFLEMGRRVRQRVTGNDIEKKYSYFEVTTALAFDAFARAQVDLAVVEVGLGGRFDATNVIEPILCVITRIARDHEHVLGHTPEEIAFEKAGIIKAGVPVVIGPMVERGRSPYHGRSPMSALLRSGRRNEALSLGVFTISAVACHPLRTPLGRHASGDQSRSLRWPRRG